MAKKKFHRIVLKDDGSVYRKQYQIPKDRYRKGDTIRAVVAEVRRDNGNPTVVISRTSPVFLEQLFENEIPEIDSKTFRFTPEINNIPKTIPATIIAVPKSRPARISNRNPTVPIETIPIAFDCNPLALRSRCFRS